MRCRDEIIASVMDVALMETTPRAQNWPRAIRTLLFVFTEAGCPKFVWQMSLSANRAHVSVSGFLLSAQPIFLPCSMIVNTE
jgi:hypothetical protein